jgi:predicted HAD superfamily Cof-like phosphohydrolase
MSEQLALDLEYDPIVPQSMVEQFHHTFGAAVDQRTSGVITTRIELLHEEFKELNDELVYAFARVSRTGGSDNWSKVAKELADLLYVVYGTAVSLGIDAEEAFRRVHDSNMSKLGLDGKPIVRDDGKVLKGPKYYEPSMAGTYREDNDE